MLKKRILASSMASVMALSSVSVVAFADETATANDFGEAVTIAELKECVKSFDKFIEDELDEYGTIQSEQFLDAYDHAKKVCDTKDATQEDATAAYQMLKAVRENMELHTKEELQALLDDYKADYDTENIRDKNVKIYGEEDNIWDAGKFNKFAIAYADSERCVEYDNGRDITNLYVELKNAHDELEKKVLKTVTKSQFRAAMKEYEALISSLTKYEDWRRGKFTVNATTGGMKSAADKALDLTEANITITFADLKDVVTDASNGQYHKDGNGVIITHKDGAQWIKNVGGVEAYITDASEKFEAVEKSNVTSNPRVYAAYQSAIEAVKVFNGWKADRVSFGRKENLTSLMKAYNDKLVKAYPLASATATFAASLIGTGKQLENLAEVSDGRLKVTAAGAAAGAAGVEMLLAAKVDSTTGKFALNNGKTEYEHTAGDKTLGDYIDADDIEKGYDLTSFVPITNEMVAMTTNSASITSTQVKDNNVKAALVMIETYLKEAGASTHDWPTAWAAAEAAAIASKDASNVVASFGALDPNDIVVNANANGSSDEYTLIYRWATYAFADKMPEEKEDEVYKRADLKVLIEKCYILADDIGDFEYFSAWYNELVEARKGAIEYQREADAEAKRLGKDYKDGKTPTTFDLSYNIGVGRTNSIAAAPLPVTKNTTDVYKALNDVYKATSDEFAKYPVSYGDIAELIADTSEAIESGVYGDAVAEAVNTLAFKLSTITEEDTEAGNEAFDDERALNKFNRLRVDADTSTDAEKDLYEAYNALLKAVEEAEKEPEVVKGDLDDDGIANAKDALMIVQYAVGEITLNDAQKAAADFDGNGFVNADDALAIVKASVGL